MSRVLLEKLLVPQQVTSWNPMSITVFIRAFHLSLSLARSIQCKPFHPTGVLISPYPDQEGNKLQRQKILSFIYPIYNHNWRKISTIYIYNKTSIKRNILTIKQNTSGSKVGLRTYQHASNCVCTNA